MKRLFRTPVVLASLIVNLAATGVFAQSEKISLRVPPKPNQTIHITLVHQSAAFMSITGRPVLRSMLSAQCRPLSADR